MLKNRGDSLWELLQGSVHIINNPILEWKTKWCITLITIYTRLSFSTLVCCSSMSHLFMLIVCVLSLGLCFTVILRVTAPWLPRSLQMCYCTACTSPCFQYRLQNAFWTHTKFDANVTATLSSSCKYVMLVVRRISSYKWCLDKEIMFIRANIECPVYCWKKYRSCGVWNMAKMSTNCCFALCPKSHVYCGQIEIHFSHSKYCVRHTFILNFTLYGWLLTYMHCFTACLY